VCQGVIASNSGGCRLSPQHYALARREGHILAGTHRFAVATLDAAVDFLLDALGDLEVSKVLVLVVADDDAWIEDAVGGRTAT
jgi:hypothetical protein